jgi:hypothetical protein
VRIAMKHYEYEISLYTDGELNDDESREMFAHLAGCTECRNLYAEFVLLEKETKECYGKNISETIAKRQLPEAILNRADASEAIKQSRFHKNTGIFYKTAFYTTAAAAVILCFLLINAKTNMQYIRNTAVKVDTVFVPKEKKVIKYIKLVQYPEKSNRDYLEYVNTIPTASANSAMD